MAITNGSVAGSYIGTNIIEDTTANATAETADASGGTLYQVYIDNTENTSRVFVKLYAHASPTVGTHDPDFIFPAGANETIQFDFPQGVAYVTALTFACVTVGGTAGTVSPTNAVKVRLTIG